MCCLVWHLTSNGEGMRKKVAVDTQTGAPLKPAVQSMRHQTCYFLRLKTPTPVGIAGEICVAGAGIGPELTSSACSRAQRIRRERIIGWTLAVFANLGLMAAGFSKAKACAL